MRTPAKLATFGAALVVLTVGAAPFLTSAADHLDAPSLGSLSVGSLKGDRDINDVFVFQGANAAKTVIAVTTNPAAGALAPTTFGTNVRYEINVDNTGDAIADHQYVATFGAVGSGPDKKQAVSLTSDGTIVAAGATGNTVQVAGGGKLWAGLRSDPFFFDLLGFRGSLGLGPATNTLCDGDPDNDFFTTLNTMAIILEVPDGALGTNIGVWADTKELIDGSWVQIDQMGRPAINTVFNHTGADKEDFNVTAPADQRTAFGGKFRTNIVDTLLALSALDSDGAYTATEAGILADVLLPDVVTYNTTTTAAGPLNGRNLADDVIDAELNITTGGFPFAGRTGTGGVPSDCVGPHSDYLPSFPYLGLPH